MPLSPSIPLMNAKSQTTIAEMQRIQFMKTIWNHQNVKQTQKSTNATISPAAFCFDVVANFIDLFIGREGL